MSNARYKWMLFLVSILLVSNIVLAFFLFSSKDPRSKEKGVDDMAMVVYKKIGLSATQIDSFKLSRDVFFKEMRPIWSEIRMLKDSLYKNMDKGLEDSTYKQLIQAISNKSQLADQMMYTHFVEMRALCTEEQKIRFDTIVPKLVNRPWRKR